jgi:hypothetical protein
VYIGSRHPKAPPRVHAYLGAASARCSASGYALYYYWLFLTT